MPVEIIAIGEALVEVMRTRLDDPLDRPSEFVGPFPSGAPAIFADAAARLGHRVGFIGAVGDDDFGTCLLSRLRSDGVDTAHCPRVLDRATGVAFVTYFSDGSRRFLYHIAHAAAGLRAGGGAAHRGPWAWRGRAGFLDGSSLALAAGDTG